MAIKAAASAVDASRCFLIVIVPFLRTDNPGDMISTNVARADTTKHQKLCSGESSDSSAARSWPILIAAHHPSARRAPAGEGRGSPHHSLGTTNSLALPPLKTVTTASSDGTSPNDGWRAAGGFSSPVRIRSGHCWGSWRTSPPDSDRCGMPAPMADRDVPSDAATCRSSSGFMLGDLTARPSMKPAHMSAVIRRRPRWARVNILPSFAKQRRERDCGSVAG